MRSINASRTKAIFSIGLIALIGAMDRAIGDDAPPAAKLDVGTSFQVSDFANWRLKDCVVAQTVRNSDTTLKKLDRAVLGIHSNEEFSTDADKDNVKKFAAHIQVLGYGSGKQAGYTLIYYKPDMAALAKPVPLSRNQGPEGLYYVHDVDLQILSISGHRKDIKKDVIPETMLGVRPAARPNAPPALRPNTPPVAVKPVAPAAPAAALGPSIEELQKQMDAVTTGILNAQIGASHVETTKGKGATGSSDPAGGAGPRDTSGQSVDPAGGPGPK